MMPSTNIHDVGAIYDNLQTVCRDRGGASGDEQMLRRPAPITKEHFQNIDVIDVNKQGHILLCASGISSNVQGGAVALYGDLETFTSSLPRPTLPGPTPSPVNVFTALVENGIPDGKWIDDQHFVISTDAGSIELWRVRFAPGSSVGGVNEREESVGSECVWSQVGHDDIIYSLDLQRHSRVLLTGGGDGVIRTWNIQASQPHLRRSLNGHTDIVWCVCSHPTDTNLFLSCSQDRHIMLWDMRKDKPAQIIAAGGGGVDIPMSLSWQPAAGGGGSSASSGYCMCCGTSSGTLVYRDVRQGMEATLTRSPHPHPHAHRPVNRVRFNNAHTNIIASVSDDCTVSMSKLVGHSLKRIYPSSGSSSSSTVSCHSDMVKALCWLDADTCYTGAWDGQILRHSLPTQHQ